jgi:hypothetical protein
MISIKGLQDELCTCNTSALPTYWTRSRYRGTSLDYHRVVASARIGRHDEGGERSTCSECAVNTGQGWARDAARPTGGSPTHLSPARVRVWARAAVRPEGRATATRSVRTSPLARCGAASARSAGWVGRETRRVKSHVLQRRGCVRGQRRSQEERRSRGTGDGASWRVLYPRGRRGLRQELSRVLLAPAVSVRNGRVRSARGHRRRARVRLRAPRERALERGPTRGRERVRVRERRACGASAVGG